MRVQPLSPRVARAGSQRWFGSQLVAVQGPGSWSTHCV
jgi:hypothetical protein